MIMMKYIFYFWYTFLFFILAMYVFLLLIFIGVRTIMAELSEALKECISDFSSAQKIREMARRQYRLDGSIDCPKSLNKKEQEIFKNEMWLIMIEEDATP